MDELKAVRHRSAGVGVAVGYMCKILVLGSL